MNRILVVIFFSTFFLINSRNTFSENSPDFIPPDFNQAAFFQNNSLYDKKSNLSQTTPIPQIVQMKFQELSKAEFNSINKFIEKNPTWANDIIAHSKKYFFATKIQLPTSFGGKELYALRITFVKFPKWFFIFYDPQQDTCSSNPSFLETWNLEKVDFDDLLGDGKKEIVFETYFPDGSVQTTVTRYYSCGPDLSSNEVFAFVNQMESGQCSKQMKITKKNKGIVTLSIKEHCNNPEGPPDWDVNNIINFNVKDFKPVEAEKNLLQYFDRHQNSSIK